MKDPWAGTTVCGLTMEVEVRWVEGTKGEKLGQHKQENIIKKYVI